MTNIALSYRQSDAHNAAERLCNALSIRYEHVTPLRLSGWPSGTSIDDYIDRQLNTCDVLLAIIGSDWVGRKPDGTRRIDHPADYVHTGLQAAFQRDIPVIPILVEGAEMPPVDDLPDALNDLGRWPPISLDVTRGYGRFTGHLAKQIDEVSKDRKPSKPPSVSLKERLGRPLRSSRRIISGIGRQVKATRTQDKEPTNPTVGTRRGFKYARVLFVNLTGIAIMSYGAILNSTSTAITIPQLGNSAVGLGVLLVAVADVYFLTRLLFGR